MRLRRLVRAVLKSVPHDAVASGHSHMTAYSTLKRQGDDVVVQVHVSGDTSSASGLAVDRFPVANGNGMYDYTRKLHIGTEIPARVAKHLDRFHIVVHGIDTNHDGEYDFSKGSSDLDPSLPQEATVPAACGLIR